MRRALLVAVLLAAVAAPAAMAQVNYSCSPAPADCSGWRNGDVTLRWFLSPAVEDSVNCPGVKQITEEGVTNWTCEARVGADWIFRTATVMVDKTAPRSVAATPSRQAEANGWYRSSVRVSYSGSDTKPGIEVSGIASCTSITYVGPDTGGTTLTGTCRDGAGNVSPAVPYALRFDATPPAITSIAPARPPDHGTWYRQPVGFSVAAADATSGLAGCDPVTYAGPDSAAAVVHGTCRDRAGNVASRAFSVPFDATPPALGRVRTFPADGVVRLDWAAAGASEVEVARSPGRRGEARTVLHRGPGTRLIDRAVRNGRRYEYAFTAVDQAGNVATKAIGVTPGPRLLAPAARARLDSPPVLRWTPVRGAQYYNVQLFHEGRKELSAWPSRPRLALRASWRYRGRRRLEPGRYRWLVWPGEGPRSRNEYGPAIGRRSFVIVPNT